MSKFILRFSLLLTFILIFTSNPVYGTTGLLSAAAAAQEFTNSLGMKMVLVRPDQFLTGTLLDRANWQWYEGFEIPRWVRLSKPFYLAAHEVTNVQYREFVSATGRSQPKGMLLRRLELLFSFEPWKDPEFNSENQPVVCVSYADAEAFCQWLSKKDGKTYRLPTSDEWEYSCRAGWGTDYNWGSDDISVNMSNYDPFLVEYDYGGAQPIFSVGQAACIRGGHFKWNAKTQQAVGEIHGKSFKITVGKRVVEVDGKTITMDTPAALQNDEVMVPTSFLAFDLGLIFTGYPLPVGSFKPNDWGLYDMHGNVNEITSTAMLFQRATNGDLTYENIIFNQNSPSGYRVLRGGGWNDSARRCRSASLRNRWRSNRGMAGVGFRVLCEAPVVRHLDVTIGQPVVVKSSEEDQGSKATKLLQLRNGTLIIQDRMSKDRGKTWNPCPTQPNCCAIEMSDGTILSIPSRLPRDKAKPPGWCKAQSLISNDGWNTVKQYEATFHVPEAVGGFNDRGDYADFIGTCDHDVVEMPNCDLLMTMYGFFRNARVLSDYQSYPIETQQWKYVSWIVKSSDKGKTWRYFSTSIYHPQITRGGGAEEGLIRLANGDLLLAARTGEHGYPNERMLFIWSKDGGRTWVNPRHLHVDEKPLLGIYPQFVLMQSGILAMTWGRTGYAPVAVAFSLDGRGETWTDFTPIPVDKGGYNDMVEISPGTLLLTGSKRVNGKYDLRVIPVTIRRK